MPHAMYMFFFIFTTTTKGCEISLDYQKRNDRTEHINPMGSNVTRAHAIMKPVSVIPIPIFESIRSQCKYVPVWIMVRSLKSL